MGKKVQLMAFDSPEALKEHMMSEVELKVGDLLKDKTGSEFGEGIFLLITKIYWDENERACAEGLVISHDNSFEAYIEDGFLTDYLEGLRKVKGGKQKEVKLAKILFW